MELLDSSLSLELPHELLARLEPLLPRCASARAVTATVTARRAGEHFLVHDGSSPRHARDVDEAIEVVLETINRLVLDQCRDFAVHAGAVARGGAVLALPGASGAGKTTLVGALLRQGWAYVSDEALVLAQDGRVRAYPKWLSMHAWTLDRLGLTPPVPGRAERPVPARELSASPAEEDELRVAHVVLMSRRPGPAQLTGASRAEAAAELLRSSFNHYRDPVGSVTRVADVLRCSGAYRLWQDDPESAAAELTARLP